MKDPLSLEVAGKIRDALKSSDYDGLVVVGSDHLRYLSGASFPPLDQTPTCFDRMIILLWPKGEEPILLCPKGWESTLRHSSWIDQITGYLSAEVRTAQDAVRTLFTTLSSFLKTGSRTRVGVDLNRVPHPFLQSLRESHPQAAFVGCERWLAELRMVKTPREIELLEDVAYRTDHGILGACHHVLTTAWRPEKGMAEIIRVHCLERGLDALGYHSVAQGASGTHAEKFWPLAPEFGVGGGKALAPGEMVRLEIRASLQGYWSDAARMLVMGEPTADQARAYGHLVALRDAAVRQLRPGSSCGSVFSAVEAFAKQEGIAFLAGLGLGHGVGVTPYEAPFLTLKNETEIKEGMVLVLDPVIYGPGREIMRSKDTVVITRGECEIVGWYKDWREPYVALSSYQHGGG